MLLLYVWHHANCGWLHSQKNSCQQKVIVLLLWQVGLIANVKLHFLCYFAFHQDDRLPLKIQGINVSVCDNIRTQAGFCFFFLASLVCQAIPILMPTLVLINHYSCLFDRFPVTVGCYTFTVIRAISGTVLHRGESSNSASGLRLEILYSPLPRAITLVSLFS